SPASTWSSRRWRRCGPTGWRSASIATSTSAGWSRAGPASRPRSMRRREETAADRGVEIELPAARGRRPRRPAAPPASCDEEVLTVKTLREQMQSYGAYHKDPRNKLTHFFGVPLVTFALFLFLGWFRFVHAPDLPITLATLFYLGVSIYYFKLDPAVALL